MGNGPICQPFSIVKALKALNQSLTPTIGLALSFLHPPPDSCPT